MIAENRHFNAVHKKKFKLKAKCRKPNCIYCHTEKVLNIPSIQLRKQLAKEKYG